MAKLTLVTLTSPTTTSMGQIQAVEPSLQRHFQADGHFRHSIEQARVQEISSSPTQPGAQAGSLSTARHVDWGEWKQAFSEAVRSCRCRVRQVSQRSASGQRFPLSRSLNQHQRRRGVVLYHGGRCWETFRPDGRHRARPRARQWTDEVCLRATLSLGLPRSILYKLWWHPEQDYRQLDAIIAHECQTC